MYNIVKEEMMNLKSKLKELRKMENVTQEEFAKKVDINLSTYKQYETNRTEPDIETLKKIADYYDISLDNLCDRPRPYDLPTKTTKAQKEAINIILQLNEINTIKAISYCAGLLTNQA